MDKAQLKVLVKVLDFAAKEFSNHGCNDFNLDELGLNPEELASFKEGFTKFMKADHSPYDYEGNCVQDWLVMQYLRKLAKQEAQVLSA